MFFALVQYKKEYGDCNVPRRWPKSPKLATWVQNLRTRKMRGRLSANQTHRLEAIGFVWDVHLDAWEEMFTALVVYKDKHGDCKVPAKCRKYPELGRWVRKQRARVTLTDERIRRLDGIGFIWDVLEAQWEAMFAALLSYKDTHDDCEVPAKWPENPMLGAWVGTQRQKRKNRALDEEHIKRLKEIGFAWHLRRRKG